MNHSVLARPRSRRAIPYLLFAFALLATLVLMPLSALATASENNPAQQTGALTGCENVPAGTLRIINYNDQATTVRGPDGRTATLNAGETREVPASAGQDWYGTNISGNSAIRIRYPMPASGSGCLVLGTPPPAPTIPDIAQCQGIPEGTYGRPTLRIVNFFPDARSVRAPNGSYVNVPSNDHIDVPAVSGESWMVRIAESLLARHEVQRGTIDCWVLGDPDAPTPTPVPLPDDPQCKDFPTPAAGSSILRIVNYMPYPMQIQEPSGDRWTIGVNELVEMEGNTLAGEWWAHPGIEGATRWRYTMPSSGPGCFVIGSPSNGASAAPVTNPTAGPTPTFPPTPTPTMAATPIGGYTFPIYPGTTLERDKPYTSESGNHYLIFQPDGNLVVYDKDGNFKWGLNEQTPGYAESARVIMQPDGNLVVLGAADKYIWSALTENPDASARLILTPEGVLQLVSRNTNTVLWSSDGVAGVPAAATEVPQATVAPAEATAVPADATAVPATLAPTAVPTVAPTPTPEKTACTQEDFLKAVKAGESSGTITLDGTCLYKLTKADNAWSGGNGAFVYDATTIEGNGAVIERDASAPQFRVLAVQAPNTVVRNLTIRNGNVNGAGGGIYIVTGGTLENVTFEANTSTSGGAIAAQKGLVARNITVKDSKAQQGGAIFQFDGNLVLDNSRLINNQATKDGGAIYHQGAGGKIEITDTLFAQNRGGADKAAAFFLGGGAAANARFYNNTVTDSTRNPGTALITWSPLKVMSNIIANHEVALLAGGTITLTEDYNLFVDNGSIFKTANGGTIASGKNSITAPSAEFVNAAGLDYRIKKNSPAADHGNSALVNELPALGIDLDGQARPYGVTSADIGAFELQDTGGASILISKEGPHWFTSTVPVTFTLTVVNKGVSSGNNLVITDRLPDGATYHEGSASSGGTLANGVLTWQVPTLAPNASTEFQYVVTGTQTLVSRDYGVSSATEPYLATQGKVITTTLNSNLLTKLSFFPNPDGYSFENFSDVVQSDLTVDDMVAIFGANVACKTQNPCVLNATAEAWRTKWLKFVEGGHCAGMAGGSLNIYVNPNVNASDFQTPADVTFDLTKENARRNITFFAVSQSDPPANWADLEAKGLPRDPSKNSIDVLNILTKNLNDLTTSERYRISIRYIGGGGGHAMVPYAVERIKGDDYYIYVYDNNYPNDFTRAIKINSQTGAWSYVGTTNPSVPTSIYLGTKDSGNLGLTSITWHTSFPKACSGLTCPPAAPVTTTAPAATGALGDVVQVMMDGEANALVTRSDGAQVGFDPATGEWINDIDGAVAVPLDLGLGYNIPPAIQIPYEPGMTYDVQVGPRETTFGNTEAPANLNISGPGFAFAVTDLVVQSPVEVPVAPLVEGEEGATEAADDSAAEEAAPALDMTGFTVDPDNNSITVQPSGENGQTPSISLAVSQPDGSDFNVTVNNVAIDSGNAVALAFDADAQSVSIESNNAADNAYAVDLTRTNLDGTQDTFVSDSLSDSGNAGVSLIVGDEWDGAGEPAIQPITEPTLIIPAQDDAPAGDDAAEASAEEPEAVEQFFALCDASGVPASTGTDVMLRVVNAAGVDATLYWRDFNGELLPYNEIAPDGSVDQETYAGHTWVAMDGSGALLLQYTATAEPQQCVQLQLP